MSDWFADDKIVRVRKQQQCAACGHSIDPGEFSIYQRGRFYGDFFSRHLHPVCKDIWYTTLDDWSNELGDFGDGLYHWLIKQLGEVEGDLCYDEARKF